MMEMKYPVCLGLCVECKWCTVSIECLYTRRIYCTRYPGYSIGVSGGLIMVEIVMFIKLAWALVIVAEAIISIKR